MADRNWKSRKIEERIIVTGWLVLETPTSLGNGDADGLTDMPLLTDALEGRALLTGASIAGALRNYLRERWHGYQRDEERDATNKLSVVTRLFGSLEDDGEQSPLIVDDALGEVPRTELRDGVRINPKTRTAFVNEQNRGQKFDLELLEAGTQFKPRFELLLSEGQDRKEMLTALVAALQGFEQREIYLGRRKRRGFGQCHVAGWTVRRYDLTRSDGLLSWLRADLVKTPEEMPTPILQALNEALKGSGVEIKEDEISRNDQRSWFTLKAQFALDGSLLIRSGSSLPTTNGKAQPDTTHLHSKRNGQPVPVVSGTSVAGVLRHRALRIAKTIGADEGAAGKLVENLFGVDMEELRERNKKRRERNRKTGKSEPDEQPFASRLQVTEAEVKEVNPLVQTRVRIDRFTGGAYEGALFNAAPVFAQDKQQALEVSMRLRSPQPSEIGMLLLLLKDLWTSDLAIGGESSVGRGRLRGLGATLEYRNGPNAWHVQLQGDANDLTKVEITARQLPASAGTKAATKFLNDFVTELNSQLGGHQKGGGNG